MTRYEERPMDDTAKEGGLFLVPVSMRWLPYKRTSEQFRKGIKGRWQIATEYGWENCQQPSTHLVKIGE